MAAANGVGLAANQIGVSKRVFVYDCADERGRTTRRRGVVVNPVLETSEVPETMPDPDDDDEGCLSVPGESFPTGPGELGASYRVGRRRHPDHDRGHRPVCADAAARDGPSGRLPLPGQAGRQARAQREEVGEVARLGCAGAELDARQGSRSVRSLARARRRSPRHGAVPVAGRIGAAADRRDRAPARRSARRCGCAPNAVTWWTLPLTTWWRSRPSPRRRCGPATSATSSTRPHSHGPASNNSGSTAGCCASAEAAPGARIQLSRWMFRLVPTSARSSTGTPPARWRR